MMSWLIISNTHFSRYSTAPFERHFGDEDAVEHGECLAGTRVGILVRTGLIVLNKRMSVGFQPKIEHMPVW